MPMPGQSVLAHHLIWTLYGHWLPNDPRGSGSCSFIDDKLAPLGDIHHGRKPLSEHPSRSELRNFQRHAEPLLTHRRFWIDPTHRKIMADSLKEAIGRHTYPVWGCAILSNHMHMVIHRHRDDAMTMWLNIADRLRMDLQQVSEIGAGHPVWADRPYKVFLFSPEDTRIRIRYVVKNPEKKGLPPQSYGFVKEL